MYWMNANFCHPRTQKVIWWCNVQIYLKTWRKVMLWQYLCQLSSGIERWKECKFRTSKHQEEGMGKTKAKGVVRNCFSYWRTNAVQEHGTSLRTPICEKPRGNSKGENQQRSIEQRHSWNLVDQKQKDPPPLWRCTGSSIVHWRLRYSHITGLSVTVHTVKLSWR